MEEVKKHERNCVCIYIYTLDYPTDIIQSTFFFSLLSAYFTPVSQIDVLQHTHFSFAYDNTIYTVYSYNMNNDHDINTYLDGSEPV